jgi:predicted CDP-diglyceride synthetase/phosphatidate cytidylyltransferase
MTGPPLELEGSPRWRGVNFLGVDLFARGGKRDRGVKDWGRMIEGHGGMLDRLDSVIFAAPIFFHMTRYWFTM